MVGKGGWKPNNLTSIFNICINAISVVPSGCETDARRANTDVRWVGFHPLGRKAITSAKVVFNRVGHLAYI